MKKLLLKKAAPVFMAALALYSCKKETSIITPPVDKEILVTKVMAPIGPTFSQLSVDTGSKSIFLYNTIQPKYLVGNRGWQGCASIGIEHNNIFSAWYAGVVDEEPGNYITVAVSADKGKSWKTDVFTIAPDIATNRQIDPMFWNDKYGNLHLSWTKTTGMWDGAAGGIWEVMIKYEDSKVVITQPTRMFPGLMNVKPIPINNSSRMLFTVSGPSLGNMWGNTYPITPTPNNLNGPFIYIADYDENKFVLKTPTLLSKIPAPTNRNFDEHMVVDLDGSNYLLMKRQVDGLYFAKSANAGITWTMPTKFTDVGATVASRPFFAKLKSGNIIFILNNSTIREKMTVYLSKDNGKTWPYHLMLDARAGCSYPDATQDTNGDILAILDFDRPGYGHINFARFTEQNIVDGISPTLITIKKIK